MIETTGTIPGEGDRPEIFFRRWVPERTPDKQRPVLAVCHGFAEHSGRYAGFARHFTGSGFSVYALDLRGHGRSGGERGFVRRLGSYAEDLRVFLDRVRGETEAPIVLAGHSMGGAVSLICTGKYGQSGERPEGLILSAPALRLAVEVGFVMRALVALLAGIAPRLKAAPGVADLVSRDPAVVEEYKNDPLVYTEGTKIGMARLLMRAEEEVFPHISGIDLPVLIIQGREDKIIDTESSRIVYETVASRDKNLKYYDGLYHEIFNEPEREEVFADAARWLEERGFTGGRGGGKRPALDGRTEGAGI